ncbi:hypothetical protein SAMN04487891_104136 [Flagellimonas taeanensis]|uniref:DoxX protein n=2 Tax=Flagellimonas TaxID=444459 RepID=A0A1M6X775_9FLAO|nr:hypothetical protein SAMN04487891_104136 [Allomuricauda taeanensis]SHL01776.1 hypothetical protein SAMN05216293_2466 [Allomuricauda taeanensis]
MTSASKGFTINSKNMILANVQKVQNLLKYTFGIVPIVAGLDKFTNLLTDWSQYMSTGLIEALPVDIGIFMGIIGVVEIAAGVVVFVRTIIGGYIVALWLTLIALVLIFTGNHFDVAVRDLVMAIAALSLVKLSE